MAPKSETNPIDTISNVIQGLDVLVNWFKAQEGLSYNLYSFTLQIEDDQETEDAPPSLGTREDLPPGLGTKSKPAPQKSHSLATKPDAPKTPKVVAGLPFLSLSVEPQQGSATADFCLISQLVDLKTIICTITLKDVLGFDTAIGSQVGIEFSGRGFDGNENSGYHSHLIIFKGFVNKVGPGFGHFVGSVIVRYTGFQTLTEVSPLTAIIIPEDEGKPSMRSNGYTLTF